MGKSKPEKKLRSNEFLHNYINAYSPVAQEWEGQTIWMNYIRPYVDELKTDSYGTAYGILKGKKKSEPYKVVIEAHCDEISWIISYIDADGLMYVSRNGGSDSMIAPSMKALIHTRKNGRIPAVFGFPAIHTRDTASDKGLKPENLFVDAGVENKEELTKMGVEVGNIITFVDTFQELGDYYVGKSLDNKIGGYIIAETLRRISENGDKLPYDLYVVNSVQEEVGLYGARNIAQHLKADLALVHDVCHSTNTPGVSKIKNGDIKAGKGPTLEYSSQNHRLLLDYIREIAEKNEIPYQTEVGSYGNDTMGFFLANTVTAIIASPLKYMHTTCEMVHKKDVEAAIDLFYNCLVSLKPRKWNYYE